MTKQPHVGVFHPGTQHSWQTALAFQENDQLSWYATSVFYDAARWPYRVERWLPSGPRRNLNREFRRRHSPLLRPDLVHTFGLDEWLETAARRLGWHRLSQRFNIQGNARFADGVIRLLQRAPVDVVWGYNSSSLEVFRWAKRHGIICVLDQTIGHPRALNRIMVEEHRRHPEFFISADPPHDEAWIRREDEEVALADYVLVGSEFSRSTLVENGCPPEKIRVVPYGYDEALFPAAESVRPPLTGRPVDFLFVGSVHPRKGVASLMKAFETIPPKHATLTLVGALGIPPATFARYAGCIRHVAQVPRSEVVERFRAADAFVFPSLFEGGGIVLYEAAAAGLGVIQSKACGTMVGADCPNGIALDEVSVPAVRQAIESVLDEPACLEQWSRVSCQRRSQWGWNVYRERARGLLNR